jgi:hypothetical protein
LFYSPFAAGGDGPFPVLTAQSGRAGEEPFFWGARFGHFKNCFMEEREMLNKKLVLGSLAGATLLVGAMIMLPATASAGLMSGTCVDCHTMHDSVDGTAQGDLTGPKNQLLKWNGCVGCHATGTANDGSGRSTVAPKAPQVNDATTNMAAGGYFVGATTLPNPNGHDVADMDYTMGVYATANAPGGSFVLATTSFNCTDCHGEAVGGHHKYAAATSARTGVAGSSYRMLRADTSNNGTMSANYVANTRTDGNYVPNADYDAASTDLFCADCHGGFHGLTNTDSVGDGSGAWIRHPTGVETSTYGDSYTGAAAMPTGNDTGVGNESLVMCLSCHAAHSTANADMLRFNYTTMLAGDGTNNGGCETCHGSK